MYVSFLVPDMAKVKSYHTLELNGFVYIWYHAEGIEPTWTPPEVEEITRGEWAYRGRTEHHVNAHIEVRCLFKFFVIYSVSTFGSSQGLIFCLVKIGT